MINMCQKANDNYFLAYSDKKNNSMISNER